MPTMSQGQAIGGYLPLEVPICQGQPKFAGMHRFQSARAALVAYLLEKKPAAVWVPHWVCGAVTDAANHAEVRIRRYALDDGLEFPADLGPGRDELVLYPNYFGVMELAANRLVQRFGPNKVVLDNAQALFAPIPNGCTAIMSPRKFVGVPDGGLLATPQPIRENYDLDTGSISRSRHLLTRLDAGPEAGYSLFQDAEVSLGDCVPRRMSNLSSRLLDSIDFETVRQRRNRNAERLHGVLAPYNEWPFGHGLGSGPLCYPFLPSKRIDKRALSREGLFIPTYWPEVDGHLPHLEQDLCDRLLPLPIDQGIEVNNMYLDKLRRTSIIP